MSNAAVAENELKENITFEFSPENKEKAESILAKYPADRRASSLLPLLDLAQRQNDNWLPREVMDYVASYIGIAPIRVYEVASFYTMFNLKPVGKYLVQVCRTTPCWLRGSDDITEACKRNLGIGLKETTDDNKFTLIEVECLGACVNAPMVQINDNFFEDLDSDRMEKILNDLRQDKEVEIGSQIGRTCGAPEGDLTSLTEIQ
ncbi:MAG: NADH-quinone oxidoreductase subunit NuoE [Rickettsiales bacterium]|nr:NADH-quinone oxidoreductase subunit NuoE [Rickettsiales bacterium]